MIQTLQGPYTTRLTSDGGQEIRLYTTSEGFDYFARCAILNQLFMSGSDHGLGAMCIGYLQGIQPLQIAGTMGTHKHGFIGTCLIADNTIQIYVVERARERGFGLSLGRAVLKHSGITSVIALPYDEASYWFFSTLQDASGVHIDKGSWATGHSDGETDNHEDISMCALWENDYPS